MKNALCIFLGFVCFTAFGQKHVDRGWKASIDSVFGNLDKTKIPKGILLDYAMEFTNVAAYNGTVTDSTDVDVNVIGNIYKTLLMGRVSTDTTYFPLIETYARRWAQYRQSLNATKQGTIVLGGLLYGYSKIDEDAYPNGKIAVVGNSYQDKYVNGVWQNPYVTGTTFAIAPGVNSHNGLSINVILPQDMLLTNLPGSVQLIEADFGDGKGMKVIQMGQQQSITYDTEGIYDWKFKITLSGNQVLYSSTKFGVLLGHFLNPDYTVLSIPGAILSIDYAPGHGTQIIRPLIVAEGFDTGSITKPEQFGGDRTLMHFKSDLNGAGQLQQLLNGVNNQQFDIIYIDWTNGTNNIQYLSDVLEDVIGWVNQKKQQSGSTAQNVFLGQSMGGLIGRYTLARMEGENTDHDVELFIAHDSPLQGANIPLSIQYCSRHLLDEYVSSPILYGLAELIIPTVADLLSLVSSNFIDIAYPSPQDLLTLNDTPAAMQMLYYYVDADSHATEEVHQFWQQEFDNGYPQQCENISISNGNECAMDQGFAPGAYLIDLNTNKGNGNGVFSWLISAAIGVLTNDVELAFLGILPGSSTWHYDFDLKTTPPIAQTQNRLVYHGKLQYRKKVAWVLPITHTLFERSKDAPQGVVPFDAMSGGYYDMIEYLPGNITDFLGEDALVNARFNFIPVVSALDVKKNNGPVTMDEYYKVYAGGNMPEPSLTTNFENFIVGYQNGFLQNYEHISFQARNGNWLANELLGTAGNVADCSFVCKADIVTGPERVCHSGTFSVTPGFDTVSWSITPSNAGTITTGQGTTQATIIFAGGYTGSATVSATLTSASCGTFTATGGVWVGEPETPSLGGISNAAAGSIVSYIASADGATYYEWTLPGAYSVVTNFNLNAPNWQIKSSNVHDAAIGPFTGTGGYGGTVTVRACNDCGCSATKSMNVIITSYGIGITPTAPNPINNSVYRVAPNPADSYTRITLFDVNKPPATGAVVSAALYDMYGVFKTSIRIDKHSGELDTYSLNEGLYILAITIDGSTESHLLSVER